MRCRSAGPAPSPGLLCPLQTCPRAQSCSQLVLCLTKDVAQTSASPLPLQPLEVLGRGCSLPVMDAALEPSQPWARRCTGQDQPKIGEESLLLLLQVWLQQSVCPCEELRCHSQPAGGLFLLEGEEKVVLWLL